MSLAVESSLGSTAEPSTAAAASGTRVAGAVRSLAKGRSHLGRSGGASAAALPDDGQSGLAARSGTVWPTRVRPGGGGTSVEAEAVVSQWQPGLFDDLDAGDGHELIHTRLGSGAWVDYQPFWADAADEAFTELVDAVDWHAERRPMYDRTVDVPRLVAFYPDPSALPLLDDMRSRLNAVYGLEPGDRNELQTAGLCLYRDGRDSVAWHGDRLMRADDTLVAIVSLGSPRALRLRPNEGGAASEFLLGGGDLLVMGGTCQATYQHCVPKTARSVGPRVSVQFRPSDVA